MEITQKINELGYEYFQKDIFVKKMFDFIRIELYLNILNKVAFGNITVFGNIADESRISEIQSAFNTLKSDVKEIKDFMKVSALLITTEGKIKQIAPESKYFTLEELQACVGGYIEEVESEIYQNSLEIVNEEGLIKDLKFNKLAKRLLGRDYVGNVLICPKELLECE